jgi:glycosyltransferase involved in cell wall biosynthesis
MKIGLDARTLMMPRPRGTGRNLLDAYRVLPTLRPDWTFVLYHQRAVPDDVPAPPWDHPNVQLRKIDMPGDRLDAWFQLRLPFAARQDQLDLLHCPANAAPRWAPVPLVTTIHDLVPIVLDGELPAAETRRFRLGVERGIRHSVRLITPSEATRQELHAHFGVPEARVGVVPWAADTAILATQGTGLSEQRRAELRSAYDLGQRWLVTFAGSTPRKNARAVLNAFARVPNDIRRDVRVVLIGAEPAAYRADLEQSAQTHGIADACRVLGFVPYADLPDLVRSASGMLIPSKCEGFGLPVLDAFATGVPVLASNVSSLPEVGGDAVLYCDPYDPRDIAVGITRLLDPETARGLIERGRARVTEFTWERTATALGDVYAQCGAELGAIQEAAMAGSASL